ncbi:hypothetical protein SAMN05519103_08509 [Rhizobiales bacterium GAS113]|nr:hypothetical protein SAMN05519103_08509 [Rhizobiales bacterium GAS113]
MTTKTLTQASLQQFTGSEHWYRHGLVRDVLFTDGANMSRTPAAPIGCSRRLPWRSVMRKAVAAEEFQHGRLTVKSDRTATLTCDDGNDNVVFSKEIEFTDFPLAEIRFYCAARTIMLPSEY